MSCFMQALYTVDIHSVLAFFLETDRSMKSIFNKLMICFRSDSGGGFHCGAIGGFQRASICYVGYQGNSLPADSAHAPCRSTRWNMASPWVRRLHS